MASSVSAISGEVPHWPFRPRGSEFNKTQSSRPATAIVISSTQPSQILFPACGGMRLNQESSRTSFPLFIASLPLVIKQIPFESM